MGKPAYLLQDETPYFLIPFTACPNNKDVTFNNQSVWKTGTLGQIVILTRQAH